MDSVAALVLVVGFLYGWAYLVMRVFGIRRKAREKAAKEPFGFRERTLTLDEYRDALRSGNFEPFSDELHFRFPQDSSLAPPETDHVVVLDLMGTLTVFEESDPFAGRIMELIEQGERIIVVNIKDLREVDACGLGWLIRFHCILKRNGGVMLVVNAPRYFRNMMALVKSV